MALNLVNENGCRLNIENAMFTERCFSGFFLALQACYVDWNGLEISRIINDLNLHRIRKILKV